MTYEIKLVELINLINLTVIIALFITLYLLYETNNIYEKILLLISMILQL